MKILLYTPIFGRPEITEIWAKNVWIKDVLCVLSYEDPHFKDNLDIIKTRRFNAIAYPNQPLGRKFNAGVVFSLQFNYDYLMNLDSDGILHKDILNLYAPYFGTEDFFGIDKVYFIDKKTGKTRLSKPNFWCSGRLISRKIIEKLINMGENVYYDQDIRGLDGRSTEKIERLCFKPYKRVETNDFPYVLDIKTWHSLNDMLFIEKLSDPVEQDIIRQNFKFRTIQSIYG